MRFDTTMIVGAGGIGSFVLDPIARICAYCEFSPKSLVLVDGDRYDHGNRFRQSGSEDVGRRKVQVHADRLRLTFPDLRIGVIDKYLAKVPKEQDSVRADTVIKDGTIILTCLDNDPARLLIAEVARKHKNIIIITGGNRVVDGHAHVYAILDGMECTQRLEDVYPEVAESDIAHYMGKEVARNPGDLTCEERQRQDSGYQLLATNFMVAAWMTAIYSNIIGAIGMGIGGGTGEIVKVIGKRSEVIFDTEKLCATVYGRPRRALLPKS